MIDPAVFVADAVGDKAPDVEMHLKGTRATTNEDQVRQSGGG